MSKKISWMVVLGVAFSLLGLHVYAGGDVNTKFTNKGGIANTRHNLTQQGDTTAALNTDIMDFSRNDYAQVCVYCHTPHGANTTSDAVGAPLWNRRVNSGGAYTTYATLGTSTITATIDTPGAHSLTCLSCHDGTIAIDSIINMPGSGNFNPNFNNAALDDAFLDGWDSAGLGSTSPDHETIGPELGGGGTGGTCMACHAPGGFGGATDFRLFSIGTDLTNDHPVGIGYPTTRVGVDFNAVDVVNTNEAQFYDAGDGNMGDSDVRFYYRGDMGEYAVECASCHDPHGVESTPGGTHLPTFLRKTNAGSALCQTCHNM